MASRRREHPEEQKKFRCVTYTGELILKYTHKYNQYSLRKYFPDEKEISETIGAVNAVMKYLEGVRYRKNINCYIIGDGMVPRTGMVFATNTKWNVYSIDPNLKKDFTSEASNLTLVRSTSETFDTIPSDYSILVSVHGHGDVSEFYDRMYGLKLCVSIPCCMYSKQILDVEDLIEMYTDDKILSGRNQVWIHGTI